MEVSGQLHALATLLKFNVGESIIQENSLPLLPKKILKENLC
jgi:hypothetical protein